MKVCIRCQETKPQGEFSPRKKGGFESTCKRCSVERAREWQRKNPKKFKDYTSSLRYKRMGLTADEFELLKNKYNGKCWLCKSREGCVIDHDHSCCYEVSAKGYACGKCVRGWLCTSCNTGLGHLGDNSSSIILALDYLKSYEVKAG